MRHTETLHYDRRSIVLHWVTASLVVLLWILGQTIDWFPKGGPRVAARSTHIVSGLTLAIILAIRIWWRFGGGVRLPPAGSGRVLDGLAALTHAALYLLLIGVVLLGISNAWIRGDSIFGLFAIPSLSPNKELRETIEDYHGLAANLLLGLALLHACAGLLHHFVMKDPILERMLPKRPGR
jgi:cytochrome b561